MIQCEQCISVISVMRLNDIEFEFCVHIANCITNVDSVINSDSKYELDSDV